MWKFSPILKETIWGGKGIAPFKGLPSDQREIGESWEISAVPEYLSVVSDGPDKGLTIRELLRKSGDRILGARLWSRFGENFPLLIKFIDAKRDLSLQVHPHDRHTELHDSTNGKDEMWYVISSEPEAWIASGFNHPVSAADFRSLTLSGKILDHVNKVPVAPGMAFYIPGGRIHAIGKGVFLAEIQQTSDLTYRIYDYGRLDSNGNPRELHLDKAEKVLDFNDTETGLISTERETDTGCVQLVDADTFSARLISGSELENISPAALDSFLILLGFQGKGFIELSDDSTLLKAGETLLIGADEQKVTISGDPDFKALAIYIS